MVQRIITPVMVLLLAGWERKHAPQEMQVLRAGMWQTGDKERKGKRYTALKCDKQQ